MRELPTKHRISSDTEDEVKEPLKEEVKEEVATGIAPDVAEAVTTGVTTGVTADPNVSIPSLCEITREITIKPKRKRKANKTK